MGPWELEVRLNCEDYSKTPHLIWDIVYPRTAYSILQATWLD